MSPVGRASTSCVTVERKARDEDGSEVDGRAAAPSSSEAEDEDDDAEFIFEIGDGGDAP